MEVIELVFSLGLMGYLSAGYLLEQLVSMVEPSKGEA